jgi:hypothetical protein
MLGTLRLRRISRCALSHDRRDELGVLGAATAVEVALIILLVRLRTNQNKEGR